MRKFAPDLFSKLGKSIPEDTYSLWSCAGEDVKFTESEEYNLITEFVEYSDGIHSYLLAEILRSMNEIEGDVGRLELPEEEFSIVLCNSLNMKYNLCA